ncbi:MAG: protein phosphatase 2C domain-containing protein [Synechococcaceae cyanobacterium]|nr:protein phosphatase 2C domain-containing protein [Synechococcaceae cyanobacterium]
MSHWAAPRCETRLGASHRRRNQPCQDASGWLEARDREGRPITLLAVSDGHGAAQHPHSATGSRLACEVALREAAQDLAQWDTALEPAPAWRGWLGQELPGRVVAGWLRAVADHWTSALGQPLDSFSPIPYGATLGLLVLTPLGWGYTGLGDWDLLELSPEHGARIISQEPWSEGDPEATQSLCLVGAEGCFAARSGWIALRAAVAPFHLLLSSDGLRKSCGSDADFFTLAQFLSGLPAGQPTPGDRGANDPAVLAPAAHRQGPRVEAPAPTEMAEPPQELDERCLAAALDRISSQGSGDDISVAIAAWGQADADLPGPAVPGEGGAGHARSIWIVQPPDAGWGGRWDPPAVAALDAPPGLGYQDRLPTAGLPSPHRAGSAARASRSDFRPTVLWLGAALIGLGIGLGALLLTSALPAWLTPWPRPSLPRPLPRPPLAPTSRLRPSVAPKTLTPAQEQSLRKLVADLCGRARTQRDRNATASLERRLSGVFSARKASFERLRRQGASSSADGQTGLANDPLGQLIAWSHDPTSSTGFSRRRLHSLGACEALITVLGQRWRATPMAPGGQGGLQLPVAKPLPQASSPRGASQPPVVQPRRLP